MQALTTEHFTLQTARAVAVNESNGTASIILRRTSGALGSISVNLATFDFPPANGNARSNVDYVALATNVTFGSGVLTQLVTVPIVNDHFVEGNEQLGLTITSVTGGTLGFQSNAVLTIVDNDAYGVLSPRSSSPCSCSHTAIHQARSAQAAPAIHPARTSVGQWTPR